MMSRTDTSRHFCRVTPIQGYLNHNLKKFKHLVIVFLLGTLAAHTGVSGFRVEH